jgi:hypothetical protein
MPDTMAAISPLQWRTPPFQGLIDKDDTSGQLWASIRIVAEFPSPSHERAPEVHSPAEGPIRKLWSDWLGEGTSTPGPEDLQPKLTSLPSPDPTALSGIIRSLARTLTLRDKFNALAEEWKRDTRTSSSVTEMAMHPAYQRIIGMGERALPLILGELRAEPDHWFWALKAITGEDPVPASARGRIGAMRQAWLEWGNRKGS